MDMSVNVTTVFMTIKLMAVDMKGITVRAIPAVMVACVNQYGETTSVLVLTNTMAGTVKQKVRRLTLLL
jgi:hypothetical protein